MLSRLLRLGLAAGALVVAAWAAFQLLGWLLGLVVGALLLAVRIAVLVALVAGGLWAYRRLTGRGRRGPRALERGLDWQFLRGKIDRETYLRRRALRPPR